MQPNHPSQNRESKLKACAEDILEHCETSDDILRMFELHKVEDLTVSQRLITDAEDLMQASRTMMKYKNSLGINQWSNLENSTMRLSATLQHAANVATGAFPDESEGKQVERYKHQLTLAEITGKLKGLSSHPIQATGKYFMSEATREMVLEALQHFETLRQTINSAISQEVEGGKVRATHRHGGR